MRRELYYLSLQIFVEMRHNRGEYTFLTKTTKMNMICVWSLRSSSRHMYNSSKCNWTVKCFHKTQYIGRYGLLLLLLSCFSRVWLCATPQMAAHLAPPSLGFSRQEHEWVAISFSNEWKWKVKVKTLSRIWLLATPGTAAYQASPSMGFSRQEYWSGLPSPSPRHGLVSEKMDFR